MTKTRRGKACCEISHPWTAPDLPHLWRLQQLIVDFLEEHRQRDLPALRAARPRLLDLVDQLVLQVLADCRPAMAVEDGEHGDDLAVVGDLARGAGVDSVFILLAAGA